MASFDGTNTAALLQEHATKYDARVTLQKHKERTGPRPDGAEWHQSELRCIESDWEGLAARPLFHAALNEDQAELASLLSDPEMAALVNDKDGDSWGILHVVAYHGKATAAIDACVAAGAQVDLLNDTKESPLLLAATYKRMEHVACLLRHGARADLSDWRGKSVLAAAQQAAPRSEHELGGVLAWCDMLQGKDSLAAQVVAAVEAALVTQRQEAGPGGRPKHVEADALRDAGNRAFVRGQYQSAIGQYSASLKVLENAKALGNRAACWLKLGKDAYARRRLSRGLSHQICDGQAKIVRWVPDAHGPHSAGYNTPESIAQGLPQGIVCTGGCSKSAANEYKCRSVDDVSGDVLDLHLQAVEDANRAIALDPLYEKAHFRKARGLLGARNCTHARSTLEEGLKRCPTSSAMKDLLQELKALGVPVPNPSSDSTGAAPAALHAAGQANLTSGKSVLHCAYCTRTIAGQQELIEELGDAAFDMDESKERALLNAGFPKTCPYCFCRCCKDVDQKVFRRLIDM